MTPEELIKSRIEYFEAIIRQAMLKTEELRYLLTQITKE